MKNNQETQRKSLSILRVLKDAGAPLGAAKISERLSMHGFSLSERMVRNYLDRLDREGLTRNLGRRGRVITDKGEAETSTALVIEKVGFVASRADTLAYQMTYDLSRRTGKLVVNVSYILADALPSAVRDIERAFEAGLGVGQLLGVAKAGEEIAGQEVPQGHVAIASVCSLTINGIFLKAGIPTTSVFGGLLEIDKGLPVRFAQIIRYDGTTIDPLEIFIQGSMTSVRGASMTGRGWVGAGFREVPSSSRPQMLELREQLKDAGLDAIMIIGKPNQPVLDIPVSYGRLGVVLCAGLNPVAAVHERGIPTKSAAMSALIEREEMIDYSQLKKLLS